MSTALKGDAELARRLRAIGRVFKPVAQKWADLDVQLNRDRVPVRTGRLRNSFSVKTVTTRRAIVRGHYTAYFVDKGPKAHTIRPKRGRRVLRFQDGGRTVFARSVHHRGYRGRPFRRRAAEEALRRTPAAQTCIDLWNKAA